MPSDSIYCHGASAGHPRFRCRNCRRMFQLDYTYKVSTPGVKELIVDMAFNGAGVHDTARALILGLKSSRQKGDTRPGSSIGKADEN